MSLSSLVDQARETFRERFGRPAQVTAVCPGRVNLIGEHVDYNNGLVLPLAIDRHIAVCASPSDRSDCQIATDRHDETVSISIEPPLRPGKPFWTNYLRGVVSGFLDRGVELTPFDAYVASNLPAGSGLSSSAALSVATATALEGLSGATLELEDKALLAQHAENTFAGMPCGIMDQFAVTFGQAGHLILLDCESQEVTPIPMPDDGIQIVVTGSGVSHSLAESEYAKRRQECERVAAFFGLDSLRDLDWTTLQIKRASLPDPLYRRARHVITEIERVTNCANRLQAGEWTAVAGLLYSSHESLRDDFEVSCEELDLLVEITRSPDFDGRVYGSRMTGGGFGGSTVSLVPHDLVPTFKSIVTERYRQQTGLTPTIFSTLPVPGARLWNQDEERTW